MAIVTFTDDGIQRAGVDRTDFFNEARDAMIKAGRANEICLSQAELCTGLRLEHKHGRLGCDELVFNFHSSRGQELVYVMKGGQQMTWPNGFPGDVNDSLLSAILEWRSISTVTASRTSGSVTTGRWQPGASGPRSLAAGRYALDPVPSTEEV